ncbi:MAG: DUF3018 family protein [Paracoccaceae bacterium]|nr:DUF3018 family protein [Paracoccaceae bacterium]
MSPRFGDFVAQGDAEIRMLPVTDNVLTNVAFNISRLIRDRQMGQPGFTATCRRQAAQIAGADRRYTELADVMDAALADLKEGWQ